LAERWNIGQLTGYYWLLKIAFCSWFHPYPIITIAAAVDNDASTAVGGGDGNDDAVNVRLQKICLYDSVHVADNETLAQIKKPE